MATVATVFTAAASPSAVVQAIATTPPTKSSDSHDDNGGGGGGGGCGDDDDHDDDDDRNHGCWRHHDDNAPADGCHRGEGIRIREWKVMVNEQTCTEAYWHLGRTLDLHCIPQPWPPRAVRGAAQLFISPAGGL